MTLRVETRDNQTGRITSASVACRARAMLRGCVKTGNLMYAWALLALVLSSTAGCSCSEEPQKPDPMQHWDPTVRTIPKAHAKDINERFRLSGHELKETIAGFKMYWSYTEKPPDDPNVTYTVAVDGRGEEYLETINATCVNFGKKDTNALSREFHVMVIRNVYQNPDKREVVEWVRKNMGRTTHMYSHGWRIDLWGDQYFRHMKIRARREEDR